MADEKKTRPKYAIASHGQKYRVIEHSKDAPDLILRTFDTRDEATGFLTALVPKEKK